MPPDYSPTITHLPNTEPPKRSSVWSKIFLTIIILLILGSGGLVGYAYWQKIGPFSEPPFTPENLLAGLTENLAKLNSASYRVALEIKTEAREANVEPFPLNPNTENFFLGEFPVPADFRFASEASGLFNHQAMDWETSNTQSQIKAELTGGDFSFSLDLEWIKKGLDFYFRINKFPTFFFFDLSAVKRVWVKITPADLAGDDWRVSFLESAPDLNEELQKNQEKFAEGAKKVLQIAEEEKVITANLPKRREKLGEKIAWRYDLTVNRESLIKFYERLLAEFPNSNRSGFDNLKSPEAEKVFAYLATNGRFSIWIEEHSGLVLAMVYHLRFVPPTGTAATLENKQISLNWRLELTGHNLPIVVTPPTDFKTVKEVAEKLFPDVLEKNRKKSEQAMIKAIMSSLRAEAELGVDAKGLYAKNLCAILSDKTKEASTTIACLQSDNQTSWAAHTILDKEIGNFCVDSSGLASSSPTIHATGGGTKPAVCKP